MIDCPLRFTAKGAFSLVRAPHDVRGDVRRARTLDDRHRRLIPMSLRSYCPTLRPLGRWLLKTGCGQSVLAARRRRAPEPAVRPPAGVRLQCSVSCRTPPPTALLTVAMSACPAMSALGHQVAVPTHCGYSVHRIRSRETVARSLLRDTAQPWSRREHRQPRVTSA